MSNMVGRASNTDRARYVMRTSPSAHRRKDQTITISEKDQTQGAKSEYQSGPRRIVKSTSTPLSEDAGAPARLEGEEQRRRSPGAARVRRGCGHAARNNPDASALNVPNGRPCRSCTPSAPPLALGRRHLP